MVFFLTFGILITFWVAFFDPVTELPWGIHDEVEAVILTMKALVNVAPWLEAPMLCITIMVIVAVGIWAFDKILWIIQLFRG